MRKRNNLRTVSWAEGLGAAFEQKPKAFMKSNMVIAPHQRSPETPSYSFCGSTTKIYKEEDEEASITSMIVLDRQVAEWAMWILGMVERLGTVHRPRVLDSTEDSEPVGQPQIPISLPMTRCPSQHIMVTRRCSNPKFPCPNPSKFSTTNPSVSPSPQPSSTLIPLSLCAFQPEPLEIKHFRSRKQNQEKLRHQNDKLSMFHATSQARNRQSMIVEGKYTFGYRGEKVVLIKPPKKKFRMTIDVEFSCEEKGSLQNTTTKVEKVKWAERKDSWNMSCFPKEGKYQGILKEFREELNNAVNRSKQMRVYRGVELADRDPNREAVSYRDIKSMKKIKSTKNISLL